MSLMEYLAGMRAGDWNEGKGKGRYSVTLTKPLIK